MKRYIAAATKPNKTKLRSEFIKLATAIRDMSKYEFVQILKNNDFATAQQWIEELNDLYERFQESAQNSINYVAAKIIVDGEFVGYVADARKVSGSRMWSGASVINVTPDLNEAMAFASSKEAKSTIIKETGSEIVVWLPDGTGYIYDYSHKDEAGQKAEVDSKIHETDMYYAGSIQLEFEEV